MSGIPYDFKPVSKTETCACGGKPKYTTHTKYDCHNDKEGYSISSELIDGKWKDIACNCPPMGKHAERCSRIDGHNIPESCQPKDHFVATNKLIPQSPGVTKRVADNSGVKSWEEVKQIKIINIVKPYFNGKLDVEQRICVERLTQLFHDTQKEEMKILREKVEGLPDAHTGTYIVGLISKDSVLKLIEGEE